MNFFKKKKESDKVLDENVGELYSIVKGEVRVIDETPDPMFSKKMMGDGIVFIPNDNQIFACMDAKVTLIFPTKHAIGLTSRDGLEVLIHVGIDTVELNGIPFELKVKLGQEVKAGQLLMEVDFDYIKRKGKSIYTPLVITSNKNSEKINYEFIYGMVDTIDTICCKNL